jgi:hypothetical protein
MNPRVRVKKSLLFKEMQKLISFFVSLNPQVRLKNSEFNFRSLNISPLNIVNIPNLFEICFLSYSEKNRR